jgi:hypothetical protein
MPPAFVLSQNQTLKLMYDKLRWNNRSKPASPGAVPAQIYKLVCLRMRTFARSATASRDEIRIKERHKFNRSTDTQRLSETGPPPTCPFI